MKLFQFGKWCIWTMIFCLSIIPLTVSAKSDISRLETVLKDRLRFVTAKESRIDSLKRLVKYDTPISRRLECYDALYREYLTFQFDSAMVYVDKAALLVNKSVDYDKASLVQVHRALSLATAGHFSEAVGVLKAIYETTQWAYSVWAEYAGTISFATEYKRQSMVYLDSLITTINSDTPDYCYFMAERALRKGEFHDAEKFYLQALNRTNRQDCRRYAQVTYGLSMVYKALGNKEKNREYLIKAAISDQIIPLKENLALQELAMHIKNEEKDLATANRYLRYSLEDAMFYGNRLRMLEISNKIPEIVIGYQEQISKQNSRLKLYMLLIAFLSLSLAVAVWFIKKGHRKIKESLAALSGLNEDLKTLNKQPEDTNLSRERYVSLFMDLCAAYINKLNHFQMIVKTKVKVKQYDDLLRIANNARLSDAEMKEMFFNFDTAFLKLYPDFINEFNNLL